MRTAELEKAKPVSYMLTEATIKKFDEIQEVEEDRIERKLKDQFREAGEEVIKLQNNMPEPVDGYILYLDNIYKVYAKGAGMIKKITGDEARQAKRILKDR